MTGTVGELQVLLVKHGRWIDRDEAEDLYAQANRGDLPRDRFNHEVWARSRDLTDDERRKMAAAGLLVEPRERECPACGCPYLPGHGCETGGCPDRSREVGRHG